MKAMLWEYIKELLGNAFGLAFCFWTLFCFYHIITQGSIRFFEPNMWIAWTEVGLAIAFGVLMLERIYRDIWKVKIRRKVK